MSGNLSPLLQDVGESVSMLRIRQGDAFGALAADLALPFRGPPSRSAGHVMEWARLAAEEVLLGRLCGLEIHGSWIDGLGEVPLFAGGSETLRQACDRVAWVSTAPLIREGAKNGALIRVWGLRDTDQEAWVEPATDESPFAPFAIRLGGWDRPIAGNSWQLGAALAIRAAAESRVDLQLALARDWVITGAVAGERVEAVQVGNKTTIRVRARRWLVPESCHSGFLGLIGRLQACSTLDGAWSHLSGEGTLGHGTLPWPEPGDVAEMHATVSQAVRPILAAVLLTRPERLVLWHSSDREHSERHADFLREFLAHERVRAWPGWEGRWPAVEKRLLPDNDLVEGEKALRAAGLHLPSRKTVLFNFTGGNMVMKLAVHQISRLNPDVWLIYREIGAREATEFILIRNAGHLPITGRLLPASAPPGIQWEFAKKGGPAPSTGELLGEIFSDLQPPHAVTHPGPFHADDVVGGAILRLAYGERFQIRRTDERGAIAAADIVFDIGGEWAPERGRFDHHQGPTANHPCGTPCASAGLLWSQFGRQLVERECPGTGEAEVARVVDEVSRICMLPVDAWDNGIFPDFHGQPVLPYQAVVSASATGQDVDRDYDLAVAQATGALRGMIRRQAEVVRREQALDAATRGECSDPCLLRNADGSHWLLSMSFRFPLREAADFLSRHGIGLAGVIQPNFPGREGKWMIQANGVIPVIPDECFRAANRHLVIARELDPILDAIEIEAGVAFGAARDIVSTHLPDPTPSLDWSSESRRPG